MKRIGFRPLILAVTGLATALSCLQLQAQAEQRWYQIEVTLFAYDNAMQAQEHWPLEMLTQPLPRTLRPLDNMLDILSLPEWQAGFIDPSISDSPTGGLPSTTEQQLTNPIEFAVPLRNSDFRLTDPERNAFLALPVSAHGFTDTNRALTSSPDYRVLYHNAWRQPLTGANQATPVWVSGGGLFGDRHELEGILTVRFNPGQDRVVLDARLWLTQFSSMLPASGEEIRLPELPRFVVSRTVQSITNAVPAETQPAQSWHPVQVIPVINSREMRSNEFHYVDHPAVGIVVHVFPYTVPPLPTDSAELL